MARLPRLLVAIGLWAAWTLAVPTSASALTDGDTLTCTLGGGNGITLTFRLSGPGSTPGPTLALAGHWDDASLTPLLPVYGALLDDPNFGIVGGLTYVGFTGDPLPGAPFAIQPLGVHVQFRLAPAGAPQFALIGRWADDRGERGRMGCNVTP
jgi:hypothetical protein